MTGTEAPFGAPVGEDDLAAWVDDRLEARRRAAVEAHLVDHPEVRAALVEERRQRDALRATLAGKFAEPIPARLRVDTLRAGLRRRRTRRLGLAAAAMAIFVAGGGGGALLTRAGLPGAPPAASPTTVVAEDAGAAFRTYVVEVAHPVEVDASRETHLMQWLSKRLGRPLAAPDLTRFGQKLVGGRLLPGEVGAAAQLMYEDAGGRRLTVYVQASRGAETAFRFRGDADTSTFAWIDRGFGFAVTASLDRDRLLPIAEAVYHGFEEPAAGSPPRKG